MESQSPERVEATSGGGTIDAVAALASSLGRGVFAVAAVLFLVVVSRWLLPAGRVPLEETFEDPREYTVEMVVSGGSPLAGKTLEDAGLRHLPGLYVVEIQREDRVRPAPGPGERLRAGDRLVLAGVVVVVRLEAAGLALRMGVDPAAVSAMARSRMRASAAYSPRM